MSTYVTALIAGPYHVVRDHHDGIDLGIFCRSTLAEHLDAERLFTETKQGFDFYHGAFGVRYPFGKYDQLFVPEFNAGAMENAGAVTFREEYVFRSRVTRACTSGAARRSCTRWRTCGSAIWSPCGGGTTCGSTSPSPPGHRWSLRCRPPSTRSAWTTFANVEKSWAYVQDQLPSTHPIAADMVDLAAVEVNFDGITYAKGASVLKQLAAYVGFEEFLTGLRAYFAAHAFGNATLEDLLSRAGGDVRPGPARLGRVLVADDRPEHHQRRDLDVDDDGLITRFEVLQSGAAPGAGELRPHRLAIGLYDRDDAGAAGPHRPGRARRGRRTHRGARTCSGSRRGALVLLNDDDLTYCKARLDPTSLATVDRRHRATSPSRCREPCCGRRSGR